MTATLKRWVVLCARHDGTERRFNCYTTSDEAEGVAAALRRVGCAARAAREHDHRQNARDQRRDGEALR